MSDVITDEERHEAATEEPNGSETLPPREKPVDPTAPEMARGAHKHGLLANGVQMIRYASGNTVTLIGKRERRPIERQGGRTDKIIYKVTVSRETHTASVDVDGVSKATVFCNGNDRIEHFAVALMNSYITYNARRQRHKRARLNRRKAEALADGSARAGQEVAK